MKTLPLFTTLLAMLCAQAEADTIAHWTFDPAAPGRDVSGHGHDLQLRGEDSQFVPDERFGGALLIGSQAQPGDVKQGAQAKHNDALNPADAFTIDLWIQPGPEMGNAPTVILIDKKYFFNGQDDPRSTQGYMLRLRRLPDGGWQFDADLGFGTHAENVRSLRFELADGAWSRLTFTYDGASICGFYLNGELLGEATLKNGGGPLAPSQYPLVIGDRNARNHARFPGKIAEVKILAGAITPF